MLDHVVLLVVVPEHQEAVAKLGLARTDAGGELFVAHALVLVGQCGLPKHGLIVGASENDPWRAGAKSPDWHRCTGSDFLSFAP